MLRQISAAKSVLSLRVKHSLNIILIVLLRKIIQDLQRKPFCDAKHFTGHITFDAQLNRLSVQSLFIPNDKYKEKVMFYKYVDCS